MTNLCLENYGVSNLENREMKTIDGGNRLKRLLRAAEYILTVSGVYDAIDEFSAGFSEVNCN